MENIKITDVRFLKGDSAFLIDDGKTAILYDTGFGFTGDRVAQNIRKVLENRSLDYIFLTHSHYDHALGTPYILRHYPDCTVVAHKYASDIFRRDGAKRVMQELDRKFADFCGFGDYPFLGDELKVDIPVSDGDTVKAGMMEFEVISLPGHTKCSVAYYCREKKLLLSTETLGVFDGDKTIVPSFMVGYQMTLESIKRAEKLDVKQMVVPHYGLVDEAKTSFFFNNMEKSNIYFAVTITDMLKDGKNDEEIFLWLKNEVWHGYIKEIYPIDAFRLNTSIMVNLMRKELLGIK